MSELKDRWFWAYPTESVDCDGITGSAHEVYPKSEVDEVIAEKDKEIAELKKDIQYWTDLAIKRQRMYEKCRCALSITRSKLKSNKIVSELMAEGMPESTAYHKAKKIMEEHK